MKRSGLSRTIVAIAMMLIGWLPSLAHDFEVDGIFYKKTSNNTVAVTYKGYSYDSYYNEYIGDVVIPSSLDYNGITYSVTSIGEMAFYPCSSLTSIQIPNSVTSIGNYAFYNCLLLTSVVIPNSVTSIGEMAFYDCKSLTSIEIPNSVTSIGDNAFSYCSNLTSIVVDAGNSIYDSRNGCNAIIETASNTLIAGCQNTIIPNSVTSIGDSAFRECSSLTSVVIPNSVTSIGKSAFDGCSSLTSIQIPNSVTSIGDDAFYLCLSLTSIEIPNSVTSIGDGAFCRCYSLTSIEIPNSVTSIGESAFYDCANLTKITCLATNPPTIRSSTFSNYSAELYVPAGCISTYQSADYWKNFNIKEIVTLSTSIALNQTTATLKATETITLIATVLPENATDKSVEWTSSDETVAVVDENGEVTAIAVGEATITATTTDGSNLSASCTVTVVLTQDDGNTIFDENFDDWSSAFAQILLYEGDHNAPAAEMTAFEFDADNTPWNFSLRDSDATADYAAASHSIYANKGKSDDWMSTPQLYIPDDKCVLTFDAQTLDNTGDKLKVVIWENKEVINTLTDRVMEDYRANAKVIMDKELKSGGSQTLAGEWEHFAFDLAEYAGKEICIGFVNENENKGMVFVDNVSVKRNAEFVISLETETTVVRQDNIEIKGRIRVDNETETYTTASFTLKDAEGKTLEVISEDGLALKQGDIYSFKFANRLPLEYGKTVKYTVDVALGEHKNSVRGTIKNLSFTPTKRVVVEKMTGNTCVNCPKGIIAFDLLHDTYGELFIPVAIHTYTGDPFGSGLSAYSSFLGLVSAPSGVVNRSGVVTYPMDQDENGAWRYSNPNDPLWWDAVAAEFKVLSEADINVKSAVYNTESKTIDIPVMTKFAVDAEGLNLNLFAVILENRLDGAYQVSNLSGYTDPILGEWGQGGEYGKSAVPYTYDHVARGIYGTTWNGTGGLIPSNVVSGEVYENTLSLAIPETIRDIKNCEAVVMLIDANNGKVLNAAVGKLYDATGVVTQSIELDKEKVDLAIGTTVQLTATVLPETTANKTVTWSSSNEAVAIVDANGLVTAIGVGEAIITATTTDGTNLSVSCKVTVYEEASANSLSGKTVNTYSGASERVSVEMTNEQAITAFQCDIYLPDGISIATIDGEYDINLSSRAKSSHSLSCVEQSDGSIRLLCYSMSLATFSGNEGELFDINFNISKEIEGNYQVLINNVVLTDKAQNEYKSSTTIDFNVKAYVPADVNNDGSINVTDVVATASYILGLDTKKFIFEAADMNKDGVINVTDIVGIASIILNGGTAISVSVQRCAPNSSDSIKIEDFAAGKNQSQQVAIEMTNASDYTACQMDIRLPKGMSIAECELASVATDHMVAYRELPDGAVRVLVYSLTCQTLPDSEEGIICLRTTTDNRFEGGEIVVENILFADRGQNEYRLYDSVANVNLAMGVSTTDMDCVVYAENRSIVIISPCDQQATISSVDGLSRTYTLDEGRNEIDAPQAGVYIVTLADRTFKVMVK